MAYTPQEIEFLKTQKAKGVDAQTAFSKLQALKSGGGGAETKPQPVPLGDLIKGGIVKGVQALQNPAKTMLDVTMAATPVVTKSLIESGKKTKAAEDSVKQKLISQYGYTDQNFKNLASVGQTPASALAMEERKKKQKANAGPEWDTGKAIGTVADWLSEGTVKPIGKFAVGAAVTGAKDIEAVGKLAYELPGAIKESGGDWNKPISGLSDKIKAINEKAGEKIDLPWIGNVNMNRMDDKGKLDFFKTLTTEAATGGDAFLGALNIISPTTSVFGAALRGGLQSAAHEATNEDSSALSVTGAGVVGAGLSGLFQGVFNKITNLKTPVEKMAEKTGLDIATVEQIRTMTPEMRQEQANMLEDAFQYRLAPDRRLTPMEKLANEVTNDMRKLNAIKEKAGKGIGKVKQGVRFGETQNDIRGNMSKVKDDFKQNLDDMRIGFNAISEIKEKGILNFDESKIKNLPGDQEILANAWKEIKNVNTLDDLIVARDTIRAEMNFGKMNQKITMAEAALKKLDEQITNLVHAERPDLAELDDVFSELTRAVTAFQSKAGGKTQFTVDDVIDGTNLYNILRRSLGASNRENLKLITKLEALGNKYKLPTLSRVVDLRRMAQTAEDVARVDLAPGATTIGSRISQVAQGVGKIPTAPIQGLGSLVNAVKSAPKQKESLLSLLKKPPTEGLTEKIMKNSLAKKALEVLKKAKPVYQNFSLKASMPQALTQDLLSLLKQGLKR